MNKRTVRIFSGSKRLLQLFLSIFFALPMQAEVIKGLVIDQKTREPLVGATVSVTGTQQKTGSDAQGHFVINHLGQGTYSLTVSYISYLTQTVKASTKDSLVTIALAENERVIGEASTHAKRRMNTENAMLQAQKASPLIQSGVSQQQIARTQDRNAAEVVKRVPGISIIDDKFVIVRGLAQRYNNVWINNAAVPSTEADSRAFSFDIIPSSQLANMVIVKSPAPELPADFTGGLIKIATRDMPLKTGWSFGVSDGMNTRSTLKNFLHETASGTDWLGFDSGRRTQTNRDWEVHSGKALPDIKLNVSRAWKKDDTWAAIAAVNYSRNQRTLLNMENSRYGIYNTSQDRADNLYKYEDDQYTTNVQVGGLLNVTWKPNSVSRYELRQLANQLGKAQYTYRDGYQYISGKYQQQKQEYDYSSRMTYSGQLSGTYTLEGQTLDWAAGFNYANRRQPDRRMIDRQEDDIAGDSHYGEMKTEPTDISRENNKLDEYTSSIGVNYKKDFVWGNLKPTLKVGLYGEYRSRRYRNQSFYYLWDTSQYPDLGYGPDVIHTVLSDANLDAGTVYLYDETDHRDSYKGHNSLLAGYVGMNLPVDRFNVYAGARYEWNRMELINNTSIHGNSTTTCKYPTHDVYPSINVSYRLTEKQLLRLAYGMTVNRPEFREVSPSTYYDFDLFSMVKGNASLRTAYIQNVDLRYEFYPSDGETVNLALFYKHFKNPIEWTYLDAGGSYTYTFENATSANNYGVEVEIRKNLDFINLPCLTVLFNGSLIDSKIHFSDASLQRSRAMQGQSPYIINAGLFYTCQPLSLQVGALYNRIGKRIVGVGRVDTSAGASVNNDIPDAYEMPRDVVDFSLSKDFGSRINLKLACRDLLGQSVVYKQFPKYYDAAGVLQERSQVTKRYRPGTNVLLSLIVNL